MKADIIRIKLGKYLHKESDTILLEVISGKARNLEGGVWIESSVEDIEKLTEDPAFDRDKSGWAKYLDKWYTEGLIAVKEKDIGKS